MQAKELVAGAIAVLTACSLTTDFSGLSSGGVAPNRPSGEGGATPPNDASTVGTFDAGPDAAKAPVLPTGGVVIAANASSYAAGGPQQHHVHFASNLGAYVIFYLSPQDRNALLTRITPDFVTFIDGPSLSLPHPHDNEGRNFDVAYANIGGADIFHLAISIHDGARFSLRARGRATKDSGLKFDAVSELDHDGSTFPNLDPDGPSVVILATGRVIIGSGYNGVNGHTGNSVVWMANKLDDGAVDWDHAFAPGLELELVSNTVNARALIGYLGGAAITWERGDQEPMPTSLGYALYDGMSWLPVDKVPFPDAKFDVADWSQVATTDGRSHILRFSNGAYEYRYSDPTAQVGTPPSPLDHSVGDGLLALAKLASLNVFALTKNDHVLKRATLDGGTWSAWNDVAPADGQRRHLSGNADIVMWERGGDLVGLRLAR